MGGLIAASDVQLFENVDVDRPSTSIRSLRAISLLGAGSICSRSPSRRVRSASVGGGSLPSWNPSLHEHRCREAIPHTGARVNRSSRVTSLIDPFVGTKPAYAHNDVARPAVSGTAKQLCWFRSVLEERLGEIETMPFARVEQDQIRLKTLDLCDSTAALDRADNGQTFVLADAQCECLTIEPDVANNQNADLGRVPREVRRSNA